MPPSKADTRSDIELPDQQDDTQCRRGTQCPTRDVGRLFQAGRADMVVRTYVDMLQAISHRSLQFAPPRGNNSGIWRRVPRKAETSRNQTFCTAGASLHRDHNNGHLAACRSGETSLYVPPRRPNHPLGLRVEAAENNTKILISRAKSSLRLSVRTPPFHGGESGSIPLGSAIPTQLKILSALRKFMQTPRNLPPTVGQARTPERQA